MPPRSLYSQNFGARWQTTLRPDAWKNIMHVAETCFKATNSPAQEGDVSSERNVISLGPIYPFVLGVQSYVAYVGVGMSKRKDSLRWALLFREHPESPPPEELERANAEFGGPQSLRDFIRQNIGDEPAVARYSAHFHLDESRWSCNLLPRDVVPSSHDAVALSFGGSARVEQIGYRFSNAADGLEEVSIVYLHEQKSFYVDWRGRGVLELDERGFVPYFMRINEMVLRLMFREGDHEEA